MRITHSYFIGVPGMYCNRERYMASMFGFNNFKKSHRSDYSNPYLDTGIRRYRQTSVILPFAVKLYIRMCNAFINK